MLKPCPYREAQLDGQLTCGKIVGSDREVSTEICAACPAATIGCAHLRFSLHKVAPSSLLIRWGNGKQEVVEADPPHVNLERGACAEKVIPVHSPAQCSACPLYLAWDDMPRPTRRGSVAPRVVAERVRADHEAPETASTVTRRQPAAHQTTPLPSNVLVFRRKTA